MSDTSKIDDGRQAFPSHPILYSSADAACAQGMTMREYYAALAMHAELNTAGKNRAAAIALSEAAKKAGQTIEQRIAFNAFRLADAMIAASKSEAHHG